MPKNNSTSYFVGHPIIGKLYKKKIFYTLEPDLPRLGVPSLESFQPLAAILENKNIKY